MNRRIRFQMPDINRTAAEQILNALESDSDITTHADRIAIRARFDDSKLKALTAIANSYLGEKNPTRFLAMLIRTRRCEMQDKWDMYDPTSDGDEILDENAFRLCKEILADAALG